MTKESKDELREILREELKNMTLDKVEDLNGKDLISPKAARVNAGLTINDAAKLAGISVYKLSQIEFGKRLKASEREKIVKLLSDLYKRNDIGFA